MENCFFYKSRLFILLNLPFTLPKVNHACQFCSCSCLLLPLHTTKPPALPSSPPCPLKIPNRQTKLAIKLKLQTCVYIIKMLLWKTNYKLNRTKCNNQTNSTYFLPTICHDHAHVTVHDPALSLKNNGKFMKLRVKWLMQVSLSLSPSLSPLSLCGNLVTG